MTSLADTIPVQQVDREAAAERLRPMSEDDSIASTVARIRSGKFDGHAWVQAFARHRVNARTEADQRVREAERRAVARCIEIVRETSEGFLSPEYATGQPLCSFNERFACGQCADAIESEFGMGTNERCQLLGKPTPGEQYRAALTGSNPAVNGSEG